MGFHLVLRLSPRGFSILTSSGPICLKGIKEQCAQSLQRAFLLPELPLPPLLKEEKRNENSALLRAVGNGGSGEGRISLLGVFDAPALNVPHPPPAESSGSRTGPSAHSKHLVDIC